MKRAIRYLYEDDGGRVSSYIIPIQPGCKSKSLEQMREFTDAEAEDAIRKQVGDNGVIVIRSVTIVDVIMPKPQVYIVDGHTGVKDKGAEA